MKAKEAYALSSVAGSKYDTELEKVFNEIKYQAGKGSYHVLAVQASKETVDELKQLGYHVYTDDDNWISIYWD